jgi:two-component system sensor histidine kinase ChvG
MPLAKSEDSRRRLLGVIEHDVKRLDRLISDISDAGRLDAEMQRVDAIPIDLMKLLTAVVSIANEVKRDDGVKVAVKFEGGDQRAFVVRGRDSLSQVIDNVIENARSFSPPDGSVRVLCRRVKDKIEIVVDDDGPGIRPDALDKIFERFYTDRPHQGFGQNSGLGLSISKQIVEVHHGQMWAENRVLSTTDLDAPPKVLGARFTVRLPAI